MKKTILVLSMLLIGNIVKSQDMIDLYAQEITTCANERGQSIENVSTEQLDVFVSTCYRDVYNGKLQLILNYYKLSKEQEDTFDSFCLDVLERMISAPKANLSTINENKTKSNSDKTIINSEIETSVYLEPIKITIIDIEQKQFPTFIGKDNNGKIHEFIYLKPFPTDISYRYNRILPGDKFIVSYNVIDIFDEYINDFVTYRYVYQLIKQ